MPEEEMTTEEKINRQYDRIETVNNLSTGTRVEVATNLDIVVVGTVDKPIENPEEEENDVVVLTQCEVLEGDYELDDGDEVEIALDYEGAKTSLGAWQDVPYTTLLPKGLPNWGELVDIDVKG